MTTKLELVKLIKDHVKEFGTSKPQFHIHATHYNLLIVESEDYFGKHVVYIVNEEVFVRYKYPRFNKKTFDIVKHWHKTEIENLCVSLGIQF